MIQGTGKDLAALVKWAKHKFKGVEIHNIDEDLTGENVLVQILPLPP